MDRPAQSTTRPVHSTNKLLGSTTQSAASNKPVDSNNGVDQSSKPYTHSTVIHVNKPHAIIHVNNVNGNGPTYINSGSNKPTVMLNGKPIVQQPKSPTKRPETITTLSTQTQSTILKTTKKPYNINHSTSILKSPQKSPTKKPYNVQIFQNAQNNAMKRPTYRPPSSQRPKTPQSQFNHYKRPTGSHRPPYKNPMYRPGSTTRPYRKTPFTRPVYKSKPENFRGSLF